MIWKELEGQNRLHCWARSIPAQPGLTASIGVAQHGCRSCRNRSRLRASCRWEADLGEATGNAFVNNAASGAGHWKNNLTWSTSIIHLVKLHPACHSVQHMSASCPVFAFHQNQLPETMASFALVDTERRHFLRGSSFRMLDTHNKVGRVGNLFSDLGKYYGARPVLLKGSTFPRHCICLARALHAEAVGTGSPELFF